MREAHCHIAAYGESLGIPDLSGCLSVAECLGRVRRESASARAGSGHGGWVRLAGARTEGWAEARWPTLAELDRACPDMPCVIMSFDHHAAVANSAAMAAAGLRAGQQVPPQGLVCADPKTGEATGLLIEHAAYATWFSAPEPTEAERIGHVQRALHRFRDLGFEEVHDLHSQDWLGPALGRLQRAGRLPVRVWLYPPVARVAAIAGGRAAWESAEVRLAGAKLFADGTLNSRTALMLSPYREPLDPPPLGCGPCGKAMVTPGELDRAMQACAELGLHLAVHAIGDGAVRMVLDAAERHRERDRGIKAPRHPVGGGGGSSLMPGCLDASMPSLRIEHCELIDEADVPRIASLGVVCSVQPCHLLTDVEVLTRQLPGRLDRVLPLRELIESGCRPGELLWFGSDAPIVRPDPGDSIRAAVHRRRVGAPEADAIGWGQRISEAEAWGCFGRGS